MTAPLFALLNTATPASAEVFNSTLSAPTYPIFEVTETDSETTELITVTYSGGQPSYTSLWEVFKNDPSSTSNVGITLSDSSGLSTTVSFTSLPAGFSEYTIKNTGTDAYGTTTVVSDLITIYYDKDNGVFVPPDSGEP